MATTKAIEMSARGRISQFAIEQYRAAGNYLSQNKVEMLFGQLPASKTSGSTEVGVDLKLFRAGRTWERSADMSIFEKLAAVEEQIYLNERVGTEAAEHTVGVERRDELEEVHVRDGQVVLDRLDLMWGGPERLVLAILVQVDNEDRAIQG